MRLHPTIAALRKHLGGTVLIALQIALTLAIVCNAVFIIGQRIERVHRPTGLNEGDLFVVSQQWVGAPRGDDTASIDKLDAMLREDVDALASLPDVASVTPINAVPLLGSSMEGNVATQPGGNGNNTKQNVSTSSCFYFVDEKALSTLGLRLVEGRAFNAGDIGHKGYRESRDPDTAIITKALADKLFPRQSALGRPIYLGSTKPTTVIGIVERMQVSDTGTWADSFVWNSVLEPLRLNDGFSRYAVRAKPGRLDAAMHAAAPALFKVNPMRVIEDETGVRSFDQIRGKAYHADIGMSALMGMICVVLIGVTAAGIVGLTSFWVGQRRRQIGIRRAMGARQIDILCYFQFENLLIAGIGTLIGVLLAISLNLVLMHLFEMDRLPAIYVMSGVVMVLSLGQAAAYAPAWRASRVSPMEAARSL